MEISDEHIKISIFLKFKKRLLANATVSIETIPYGFITIKDFQIWESKNLNNRLQEFINIKPPARKVFGRWIDRVFVEDESKWHELETRIYDAYCVARNNYQRKEDK